MSPKLRRLWHAHARAYRRWQRRAGLWGHHTYRNPPVAHPLAHQAERTFKRLDARLHKAIWA